MAGAANAHQVADRPSPEDLIRCVHCGFCLQACPTYLQLGLETDSPRGRIHLIRAVAERRIEPTTALVSHLDLCLQCRACETSCPSAVPFGRIMESGRAMVIQGGRAPLAWKVRVSLLRQLFPYPKRLAALFSLLRAYQRFGIQRLLRSSGLLRLVPRRLAEAESMTPDVPSRSFQMKSGSTGSMAQRKPVALLTGCVMPLLYARTHEATVRVLTRHGLEVVVPPDQRCCGALNAHAGDRNTARELARRNIDVFLATGVESVVVNSAGCGAALKEYGELLKHDPAYADRARHFSSMVKDVTELLAALPFQPPQGAISGRVAYQAPCHLAHAQHVRNAPRDLLAGIPGLELVDVDAPERCCGSAGTYGFAQPEMSLRLLDEKIRDIRSSGAEVVATANPGCMMQLEAGLRRHHLPGRVVHVIELLDEAYRAGDEGR